jgi:hypothetical protein
MAIKTAKKDKKLELRIKPKAGATDLKASDIIRREAEDQPSSVARKQTGIRNNILLPEEKEALGRNQLGSTKKPGITLLNNRYSNFIDEQISARQARQNMLDFGNRLRANTITADPLTDREGYIQQVNTRRDNSAYTGTTRRRWRRRTTGRRRRSRRKERHGRTGRRRRRQRTTQGSRKRLKGRQGWQH